MLRNTIITQTLLHYKCYVVYNLILRFCIFCVLSNFYTLNSTVETIIVNKIIKCKLNVHIYLQLAIVGLFKNCIKFYFVSI